MGGAKRVRRCTVKFLTSSLYFTDGFKEISSCGTNVCNVKIKCCKVVLVYNLDFHSVFLWFFSNQGSKQHRTYLSLDGRALGSKNCHLLLNLNDLFKLYADIASTVSSKRSLHTLLKKEWLLHLPTCLAFVPVDEIWRLT